MKTINFKTIESIHGGDICSGNGAAFAAGFCIAGFFCPAAAVGCFAATAYCALR